MENYFKIFYVQELLTQNQHPGRGLWPHEKWFYSKGNISIFNYFIQLVIIPFVKKVCIEVIVLVIKAHSTRLMKLF